MNEFEKKEPILLKFRIFYLKFVLVADWWHEFPRFATIIWICLPTNSLIHASRRYQNQIAFLFPLQFNPYIFSTRFYLLSPCQFCILPFRLKKLFKNKGGAQCKTSRSQKQTTFQYSQITIIQMRQWFPGKILFSFTGLHHEKTTLSRLPSAR